MEATIPKRIIQIYCPPQGCSPELPLFNRCALQNIRLLHPTYEHLVFDQAKMAEFLSSEPAEIRKTFDSFPHAIQRFDFFRYLALYRLGGFYFDFDVFLARNLDPLLGFQCVFPFEELTISEYLRTNHRMDWELANYAFAAAPRHRFLEKVIESCIRGHKDPKWAERLMERIPQAFRYSFVAPMTTGPGIVSRTFAENPDLHPAITILFPDDVCNQSTWQRFGDFGVHLMQASWRRKAGFLRSRLARLWENRRRRKLHLESLRLGPVRKGNWKSVYPDTEARCV
jgi:inositol phosphorylceramide mannosyltransferase catalytic subunit